MDRLLTHCGSGKKNTFLDRHAALINLMQLFMFSYVTMSLPRKKIIWLVCFAFTPQTIPLLQTAIDRYFSLHRSVIDSFHTGLNELSQTSKHTRGRLNQSKDLKM